MMRFERLVENGLWVDGRFIDPGLASVAAVTRYGVVTDLLKEDLTPWTDYPSDGFITALRVNPCDGDGRRVDHATRLLVHATAYDSRIGYADVAVNDVIGFSDVDRTWSMNENDPTYDGRLLPYVGKDGAEPRAGLVCFWARVTHAVSIGVHRWQYGWVEQRRTSLGFEDKPGGRLGDSTTDYALNSVEAMNTGGGVEGNSIDVDGADFPSGFELREVRGGAVVMMAQEPGIDGGSFYSFSYVNAVDGTCS